MNGVVKNTDFYVNFQTRYGGSMSRRMKIRLFAYAFSVFLITAGIAAAGWSRAYQYERYYIYTNKIAIEELILSINNINVSLLKEQYVNSPVLLVKISREISGDVSRAMLSLREIQKSGILLNGTEDFISQAGVLADKLAIKAARQEELSGEDRETLKDLAKTANKLSTELFALKSESEDKEVAFNGLTEQIKISDDRKSQGFIYNNFYSDYLPKKVPQYLNYAVQMSESEVNDKLAQALGYSPEFMGSSEDKLKTYTFKHNNTAIIATQSGGRLAYLINEREVKNAAFDKNKAIIRAKDFLRANSFENMGESYYYISNNIMYINFAFVKNTIMVYPDIIQVGVALDNGEICYVDANSYLYNHAGERNYLPKISLLDAKKIIDSGITVQSNKLCVIPTADEKEALCYEFKCIGENGSEYLFYLNAVTGDEEQIFILLSSEKGTLAI